MMCSVIRWQTRLPRLPHPWHLGKAFIYPYIWAAYGVAYVLSLFQYELEVNVGGPAALLVAKVHKLLDRINADDNRRINSKDAFDVFRLLQAVETGELIDEINFLAETEVSMRVTAEALSEFRELFGTSTSAGTVLVAEHVTGIEDHEIIIASSVTLSEELIERVG